MRIVIVGGGIGGLATARALSWCGVEDYIVLEQAPELTEIGAGVQLTNNAVRVLEYLGLTEEFRKTETRSGGSTYRDLVTDEIIFDTPAGEYAEKRYGVPYFQVHRRRFIDILRNAVDPAKVRLGVRCVRASQEAEGVAVELDNGDIVKGDVLIGADGIHSVVRTMLTPPEEPVFSGLLGWRSLIPYEKAKVLDMNHWHYQWWGPGRSITSYWVNGGSLLNFLGVVPSTEVRTESWKTEGDVRMLRDSFKGSCARVTGIVGMIETAFITGIFDRPPLQHYAKGRVAVIGDAAHPLWPFLANGAAQSLEDAIVIARCLARANPKDVPAALLDYEKRRLPRANYVQRRSREMEKPSHLSEPEQIQLRNQRIRARAEADPTGAWTRDWLWGYDAVKAADGPLEDAWREPAPF
jgi:salicylate hydroxylase